MKYNKNVTRIFAGILTFVLACTPVGAATGYVSTEELNVRSEPSLDAEVVDKIHQGDEVLITYGSDDGWTEIYYGGQCCYVCSDYISLDGSYDIDGGRVEDYDEMDYPDEDYDENGDSYYDYEEEAEEEETSSSSSASNTVYLGEFTLTGYCNCAQCCGTAGNQTASGTWPTQGVTVAMGGVDFGIQLMINGHIYTVEDRGTPYGHVDIYFDNHSDALAFGMQSAEVYQVL